MIRRTVHVALVVTLASLGLGIPERAEAQRRPSTISSSRPSRLVYQGACGWQGSGRMAYLEGGRRAVVTVRESYSGGPNRWSRTSSYRVEPGAMQWVGCTRGDTSVEFKSFFIAGERAF
jgi:hypothetical protein